MWLKIRISIFLKGLLFHKQKQANKQNCSIVGILQCRKTDCSFSIAAIFDFIYRMHNFENTTG